MTDIDWDAARSVPILDVLEALGIPEPNRENRTFCVFHDDADPSMHVYADTNRWWSHCCRRGYDVIDLVQAATGQPSWRAAQWLLSSGLEPTVAAARSPRPVQQIDLTDRVKREAKPCHWTESLRIPEVEQFLQVDRLVRKKWPLLHERWRAVTHNFGLYFQQTSGLWIPHWVWTVDDEGLNRLRCYGVTTRPTSGDLNLKFSLKGSTFRRLYRPITERKADAGAPNLVLCEGESDTWCMWHGRELGTTGKVAYAGLPAGAGTITDEIIDDINQHQRIHLFFDDDDAGRKAAATIRERSTADVVDMTSTIPGGRVAEAMSKGWRPDLDLLPIVFSDGSTY
jgi:hypothetical protein